MASLELGTAVQSKITFQSKKTGKRIEIGDTGVVRGPSTNPSANDAHKRVNVLFENGVAMNVIVGSQIRAIDKPPRPPPRSAASRRGSKAGTGGSSEQAATRPMPAPPKQLALALVSICDARSGVMLYERRWRWHDGARHEGVTNLVHTLLKFAQEIDDGEISCVNFDLPQTGSEEAFSTSSSKPAPPQRMQMLCHRDPNTVVATMFFELDPSGDGAEAGGGEHAGDDGDGTAGESIMSQKDQADVVRGLLHAVKEAFESQFEARIVELSQEGGPITLDNQTMMAAVPPRDVQREFRAFDDTFIRLCRQATTTAAPPAAPSRPKKAAEQKANATSNRSTTEGGHEETKALGTPASVAGAAVAGNSMSASAEGEKRPPPRDRSKPRASAGHPSGQQD